MLTKQKEAKITIANRLHINEHYISDNPNIDFNNDNFNNFILDIETKTNYKDINNLVYIINENNLFNKLKINIASLQYKIFCKTKHHDQEIIDKYIDYITKLNKLLSSYNINVNNPENLSNSTINTHPSDFTKISEQINHYTSL